MSDFPVQLKTFQSSHELVVLYQLREWERHSSVSICELFQPSPCCEPLLNYLVFLWLKDLFGQIFQNLLKSFQLLLKGLRVVQLKRCVRVAGLVKLCPSGLLTPTLAELSTVSQTQALLRERWGRLETSRSLPTDPSFCPAGARLGACTSVCPQGLETRGTWSQT